MLSPARGKIIHVLLTRAPLYWGRSPFSCDLHVLSAPLTFVLSQDQTLQLNLLSPRGAQGEPWAELSLWLFGNGRVASTVGHRDGDTRSRALREPTRHLRAYDSVFKAK